MFRLPPRNHPPGPRPCLSNSLLIWLLEAAHDSGPPGPERIPITGERFSTSPPRHVTATELLLFHVGVFLIGGWNMVTVDLAHGLLTWWCWRPLCVWAAVILVQGVLTLVMARLAKITTLTPRRRAAAP